MHAKTTGLIEPMKADEERMKRVIDFIITKRQKDDVVILFDGRSKICRRIMEEFDDKLSAGNQHSVFECWIVFEMPSKVQDPRMPAKQMGFAHNNKEVVIVSMQAKKGGTRVFHRAEFNACGESSTASTTYTCVPVRRYSELPRMANESKTAILGAAASGAVKGKRVQADIDEKGHPFSHCEVKPLNLLQRICEHNQVTHIVDFAAGSGALAVAVAGSMQYEGVAANEVHRDWLDSTLDLCVNYLAGKDDEFTKKLGGDEAFCAKVSKYFSGTMMEARRWLEPPQDNEEEDAASSDGAGSEDE